MMRYETRAKTERRSRGPRAFRRRAQQAGFSVVELIVALALTTVVLIGVARFFDSAQTVYVGQMNVAEMQQAARGSLRDMQRYIRTLGRGGFPAASVTRPLPGGLAVAVRNNVVADTRILTGSTNPLVPIVAEGTDVLTVRGVFASPIYQVNHTDPNTLQRVGGQPLLGDVFLRSTTPTSVPQDLSVVIDIVTRSQADADNPIKEALLLTSPLDPGIYGVVELDPLNSDISDPTNIRLRFRLADPAVDSDQRLANHYDALNPNGAFPLELFESRVGFVGVLEEYRFYIREEYEVPGDNMTAWAPRLSKARVYPATQLPYRGDYDYLSLDVATRVLDLQIALGCDSSNKDPLVAVEDDVNFQIYETADGKNDDWLFNGTDDDPMAKPWNNLDPGDDYPDLYFVRVTALVRSRQADRGQLARLITSLEDRDYTDTALNSYNERRYRRSLLQTVVDLRNLG